jgi:hypothetical protein
VESGTAQLSALRFNCNEYERQVVRKRSRHRIEGVNIFVSTLMLTRCIQHNDLEDMHTAQTAHHPSVRKYSSINALRATGTIQRIQESIARLARKGRVDSKPCRHHRRFTQDEPRWCHVARDGFDNAHTESGCAHQWTGSARPTMFNSVVAVTHLSSNRATLPRQQCTSQHDLHSVS